jgi:hypothetical protein
MPASFAHDDRIAFPYRSNTQPGLIPGAVQLLWNKFLPLTDHLRSANAL